MTTLQRNLAKARARMEAAYSAEREIWKVCDRKAAIAKQNAMKPYAVAVAKSRKAREAFTRAELLAAGITPMQTIVTCDRKAYVVNVRGDGYANLLRVKKDNTLFKDAAFYADHIGRVARLTITERVLK